MLSVAAMAVRNALVLGLLRPESLLVSGPSLGLMLLASGLLAFSRKTRAADTSGDKPLDLRSPFSLLSALKFGAIFLVLQIADTMAQGLFGQFGFYVISVLGGVVSSASAVAAAATLAASGTISSAVAGVGAILASIASAAVNSVLVARFANSPVLLRRVLASTALILAIGLSGAALTAYLASRSAG
jgi:uncharacterized membrane protein (DUF4010 family)